VNSELLPYVIGGCICLTVLVVVAGAIGGILFMRKRQKPAIMPAPSESQPSKVASADASATVVAQPIQESASLDETMASDLSATAINKPVDDMMSDLKATMVHRPKKEEETDDDASAV
jgi:hypothetical protein